MKIKLKDLGSVLVFLIFCFPPSSALSQYVLTVEDDLPPIRTTYGEVARFVEGLEDLVKRSIKQKEDLIENGNTPITYEFGSTDIKIAHNSLDALLKDPRLPNPAYTFQIIKSGFFNNSISFQIYFKEYFSHYQLTGTDSGLVEALQKHIDSFGHKNQSLIGSMPFSMVISLCVGGLFLISPAIITAIFVLKWPNFLGVKGSINFNRPMSAYPGVNFLFIFLTLISVAIGFYFLYSIKETLFYQTKIYLNSASFLHIYSVEIGLAIGVSGLLLSCVFWFFPKKTKQLHGQKQDSLIETSGSGQEELDSKNQGTSTDS